MSSSHTLHEYLLLKLKDLESSCFNSWTVQSRLQTFKEARDLLKAAGEDVSELEICLADTDKTIARLNAAMTASVGVFARRDLMLVTDKEELKDTEQFIRTEDVLSRNIQGASAIECSHVTFRGPCKRPHSCD